MRSSIASGRGLLSGWLIAATVPLFADPHAIAASSAAGLGARSRVALAAVEILGAALFAFEFSVVAGFVLLLGSFVAAAAIHIHQNEMPWWLAAYTVAGMVLLYCTLRALHVQGRGPVALQGIRRDLRSD
jgi:hypothetical protein